MKKQKSRLKHVSLSLSFPQNFPRLHKLLSRLGTRPSCRPVRVPKRVGGLAWRGEICVSGVMMQGRSEPGRTGNQPNGGHPQVRIPLLWALGLRSFTLRQQVDVGPSTFTDPGCGWFVSYKWFR
jgi:hypothetical protein